MPKAKHKTLIADDGAGRLSIILVLENGTDAHLTLKAGTAMDEAKQIAQVLSGKVSLAEVRSR